ncbi:aldo/keto reductase [Weissella diestrammenae]|uniref:Aldo/keto reductase n=2 Tax=Weissella diestrammenae TaxID=1162633 RepID=A0A7G9T7K7_9LACO|nr:aldo/keto reductase [Weissella diestrammenae]MCM0582097.1 aldo/keto reductase [Weissella diestrammenae]QNN76082.1 aldo/keto reductase [Weissella diestrammenae]
MRTITLNNGVEMPMIGFGTDISGDLTALEPTLTLTIQAGYRLFDTAASYGNQRQLGQFFSTAGIPRDELFITSKVAQTEQGYQQTLAAFEATTQALQTDYLDLYLVHWPKYGPFFETWRALETLYRAGKVQAIGVSNFESHHLDRLLTQATIMPAIDQVETHPYFNQHVLHEYLTTLGIYHQAWSPLGRGQVLHDPVIAKIAERYQVSVAQIILAWHLQKNVAIIPSTTHAERIQENLNLDFQLTVKDMAKIDALQRGERIMGAPDENYMEDKW